VGCHVAQGASDLRDQVLLIGFAHRVQARADSTACGRDLFVRSPFDALLEIHQPRIHEYRMRVGVNKAGQDNSAGTIELSEFLSILLQPRIAQCFFRGSDRDDPSADTKHCPFPNNAKFF